MGRKLIGFNKFIFPLILFFTISLTACGKTGKGPSSGGESAAEGQKKPSTAVSSPMAGLLPSDDGGAGWKRSGEVRVFLPETLWEYIDGGAEGYLVYNFQEVVTGDYDNREAGLQAVVDIYRMADRLCGFGIYSAERFADAEYFQIGTQGYISNNAVHFWKGPYYIKLSAFQEGEEVKEPLKKLAFAVAAKIDADTQFPPELDIFPKEGLIANTERYMARDVLGQSDLKNGFSADYKVGDTEFKIFLILNENPEASLKNYQSYKDFMKKYSKNVEDHSEEEVPWFLAEDPYYGKVVTMQLGKVMLGILGLDNPEMVNDYLQRIQRKLVAQGMV